MNIGDKIRKVRELKGFKQEYVAEKLGMSVTAYGNIERHSSDLTFGRLEEIASVLEVAVQDIISIPEQLNIHSIVHAQVGFNQTGFNYYAHRVVDGVDAEILAYKTALENSQKEVEHLRLQNRQLMDMLNKKISE